MLCQISLGEVICGFVDFVFYYFSVLTPLSVTELNLTKSTSTLRVIFLYASEFGMLVFYEEFFMCTPKKCFPVMLL